MNNHPLQEQRDMAFNYRNIGLGIMGAHDMLIKLGITYGSKESKELIDYIMRMMFRAAVIKSCDLAKEKGAFPKWNQCVLNSTIMKNHFSDEEMCDYDMYEYGLRNCSLLSIAPSGSIGTMLNISTGCEPLFQISYKRKTESLNSEDTYYEVYSGIADLYMKKFNGKELPPYFNTSSDINWIDRIDIQACLQEHVDTAISSTINLPYETTLEEIERLYLCAWERGLKGVTIYRDGCKRAGILSTNENRTKSIEDVEKPKELERGMIIKVDNNSIGKERHLTTGCGSLHCAAFFDPDTGDLLETYLSKGSSGGCQSNLAAVSRLVSLSARAGVDVCSIVDQLKSCMSCPSYAVRSATKHDTSKGNCCPSAVGNALIEMYEEMRNELFDDEKEEICNNIKIPTKKTAEIIRPVCPECGGELFAEGGCFSCKSCPYTKCE